VSGDGAGHSASAATARDVRANGHAAPLEDSSSAPLSLTARSTPPTPSAPRLTAFIPTTTLLAGSHGSRLGRAPSEQHGAPNKPSTTHIVGARLLLAPDGQVLARQEAGIAHRRPRASRRRPRGSRPVPKRSRVPAGSDVRERWPPERDTPPTRPRCRPVQRFVTTERTTMLPRSVDGP